MTNFVISYLLMEINIFAYRRSRRFALQMFAMFWAAMSLHDLFWAWVETRG